MWTGLCMLPWLYRQDLGGGGGVRGGLWGCVTALWTRYLWFLCLCFPPWVGSPFTYPMGSPYEYPIYHVQVDDEDDEGLLNDVVSDTT